MAKAARPYIATVLPMCSGLQQAIMVLTLNAHEGATMHTPSWARQALRRPAFDSRPASADAPPLTIRVAGPADADALRDLSAKDSTRPPTGEVLLAEVGGQIWAALSLDDGHTVADPFRLTGELTWLLVEHARRLERADRPGLTRRLRAVAT